MACQRHACLRDYIARFRVNREFVYPDEVRSLWEVEISDTDGGAFGRRAGKTLLLGSPNLRIEALDNWVGVKCTSVGLGIEGTKITTMIENDDLR